MNLFAASIGKKKYKPLLVIINGESNSGGYALNSEALSSELLPRDSVDILDNTGLLSFDTLDIGTNNLVGHSGLPNGVTHGFELELANRADTIALYSQGVKLIKTGQGGSQISQWNIGGGYYNTFTTRIDAAKSLITFSDYNIVVLFSLGINDAISGTNVATWKAATKVHLANMRATIGINCPIIMTQFQGMGGGAYTAYSSAISEIATEMSDVYCVDVTGAGLRDANHWNYAGMKQVAGSMLDIVETIVNF